MSTLGPEVDGAVAASLRRMELVRQVAAADVGVHMAGGVNEGFCGLPSQVLAALVRDLPKREKVLDRRPPVETVAEPELPSQSLHTFARLPVSRTQQSWCASAGSKKAVGGGQWRPLRPSSHNTKEETSEALGNADGRASTVVHDDIKAGSSQLSSCSDEFHSDDDNLTHTTESAHQVPLVLHCVDAQLCEDPVPATQMLEAREDEASADVAQTGQPQLCEFLEDSQEFVAEVVEVETVGTDEAISKPPCCQTAELYDRPDGEANAKEIPVALKYLRSLLLDVADVADWYPADDPAKLAKASILGDQCQQLLQKLEDAVVDVVLRDTVAELTRIDILRALIREWKETEPGSDHQRHAPHDEQISSYIQCCSNFEDTLRKRYL